MRKLQSRIYSGNFFSPRFYWNFWHFYGCIQLHSFCSFTAFSKIEIFVSWKLVKSLLIKIFISNSFAGKFLFVNFMGRQNSSLRRKGWSTYNPIACKIQILTLPSHFFLLFPSSLPWHLCWPCFQPVAPTKKRPTSASSFSICVTKTSQQKMPINLLRNHWPSCSQRVYCVSTPRDDTTTGKQTVRFFIEYRWFHAAFLCNSP